MSINIQVWFTWM